MNSQTHHPTFEIAPPVSVHWSRPVLIVLTILGLAPAAFGQLDMSQDFNTPATAEVGWSHYNPGTSGGQFPTWTFPADGSGGTAYRMLAPPMNCAGAFNRGGSYRSEQYTDFFEAVDVLNFDPTPFGSAFIVGGRLTHGSESAGTTEGYIIAATCGAPRARQELMLAVEFTGEVTATEPNVFNGGAALLPQFSPSRALRVAFHGTSSATTGSPDVHTGEIFDRTDLLEPIARIKFRDGPSVTVSHSAGENLIGWLNLDMHALCDFTFDNFRETAVPTTPVGFPGTAQVVSLTPAPQTLFYQPPQNGSNITFNVTTLSTTAVDTNALKVILNGTDVSSQLALTEIRTPIVGSAKTNFFVRYTGTLASNIVYQGQIVALDISGKGTTNNWVFDTFKTNGTVLIEAEDYNYGGGNFQTNPPVSGLDNTTIADGNGITAGNQVNGGGVGYFNAGAGGTAPYPTDIVGVEDVDYHDNTYERRQDADRVNSRHQYRSLDFVGTAQGLNFSGDTARPEHVAANVPDYYIGDMDPGDWMNYTRFFPSGNYNVYLRAACQGRQDVRFDQVTSDRTTSNQTTALMGQFLVPNTGSSSRYRYVPLTDASGNLQTLAISGVSTFRLTANQIRTANVAGDQIGDLELNYLLFVPTTAPASTGAWISSAFPSPNADNFGLGSTVTVNILNRGTTVTPGSVNLFVDGVNVTSSATASGTTPDGAGATISYQSPGLLLPNTAHTLGVAFNGGATTTWSFTVDPSVPLISAGDAVAGPADSVFSCQVNKGPNSDSGSCPLTTAFGNTIARAERQLAGQIIDPTTMQPFPNEAVGTNNGFYTELSCINYEQCGNPAGFFGGDVPYPGIDPANYPCPDPGPDHFAIAALIKLQLAAGSYRMGVNSDDGFKVTAGGAGGTNVYLGSSETFPGVREPNQNALPEFDFAVQTAGVYTFRMIQEEKGGGARCEWYWVNRATGARELVRPMQLVSSASLSGPYTAESAALINPSSKTITVPKSGNTRYYRLGSSAPYTLGRPTISGNNVVLTYQ